MKCRKVYVLTILENDCPTDSEGNESFYEWETIEGVTQSLEKAEEWNKKDYFHKYKVFELD
jgi:hypothetical protein